MTPEEFKKEINDAKTKYAEDLNSALNKAKKEFLDHCKRSIEKGEYKFNFYPKEMKGNVQIDLVDFIKKCGYSATSRSCQREGNWIEINLSPTNDEYSLKSAGIWSAICPDGRYSQR